jgi:putative addiction module component (TIGR02574 family)
MTVQELHAEASRLPPEQAAKLIDLLLIDTYSKPDPAIDEAWGREIDRRLAEPESGHVKGIPAEEVLPKLERLSVCDARPLPR